MLDNDQPSRMAQPLPAGMGAAMSYTYGTPPDVAQRIARELCGHLTQDTVTDVVHDLDQAIGNRWFEGRFKPSDLLVIVRDEMQQWLQKHEPI